MAGFTKEERQRFWNALPDLGIYSFPLLPGQKVPVKGSSGFNGATIHAGTIRGWQRQRDWNIGIACGASELVVVDLDVNPENGPPGLSAFLDIASRLELPDIEQNPLTVTPRGGLHVYYKAVTDDDKAIRCSTSELAVNIDIKAAGGYVVGPYSVCDGWLNGYEPCGMSLQDIKPLPTALSVLLQPAPPPTVLETAETMRFMLNATPEDLTRYLGFVTDDLLMAAHGQRNELLNAKAWKLFNRFPSSYHETISDCLLGIASAIGLPEGQSRRTIASARKAVMV